MTAESPVLSDKLRERWKRRAVTVAMIIVTLAAVFAVTFHVRLEPNVASLLPERGDSAALRRYVRGFGGGDLAVLMVAGPDSEENGEVAAALARDLATRPSVRRAADKVETRGVLDPMLAFRHADPRARKKLEAAMSPEGMRARLAETRKMLLAPGSGAMAEAIARDPLRLAQLVFEGADVGAGMRTQPDGAFANDDGSMHLVLVQAKGQSLRGEDARAFVTDANAVIDAQRELHPRVRFGITGGHAIAAATEEMLTRDLEVSGTLSMLLASLAFAVTFRRLRALLAVMPPLLIGTVWTAGLAVVFPGGLSAIAVAFMSVVVGVGVDTGVHVYAALLEARQRGLSPDDAARDAERTMRRPVLFAAVTAAVAFGALGLSDIGAVRQLGLLCAGGEVLTAIAIVIVTPRVGAWLERGTPPVAEAPKWTAAVSALTSTRTRATVVALLALAPIVAIALGGAPALSESIVAIRPKKLLPLAVQEEIFEAFGGKHGQWVVLIADADEGRARARADAVAERLSTMDGDVDSVDALTALAPSEALQKARLAARDALDLPQKADDFERALRETGFAPERFEEVSEGMRHPSSELVREASLDEGGVGILLSRYLGEDEGDRLVAMYVRPGDDPASAARVEAAIHEADAEAMVTGYPRLEASLRASLSHDMPLIALVAGGLVVLALAASLRSARDVLLAAFVVTAEIAIVLLLIRELSIPLHAYSALVLPVLLGITVDEGMFLLHRARTETRGDFIVETIAHEGPIIAATGLTTAAGFGALVLCDFDGLRDLGMVGAIGSATGLFVALLVVPAGLRLTTRARPTGAGSPPPDPRPGSG